MAGYALSTLCKIALLFVGGAWTAIMGIMALDRAGKGIRAAPRDALISLHTRSESLATAFAAHRSLDAGGMLLGPIVAFGLLWFVPYAFDAVWIASFAFGILGVAVLVLFVPQPNYVESVLPMVCRPFRIPFVPVASFFCVGYLRVWSGAGNHQRCVRLPATAEEERDRFNFLSAFLCFDCCGVHAAILARGTTGRSIWTSFWFFCLVTWCCR